MIARLGSPDGRDFCSHLGAFFPNGIESGPLVPIGANATPIAIRADTISSGRSGQWVQRFAF